MASINQIIEDTILELIDKNMRDLADNISEIIIDHEQRLIEESSNSNAVSESISKQDSVAGDIIRVHDHITIGLDALLAKAHQLLQNGTRDIFKIEQIVANQNNQ